MKKLLLTVVLSLFLVGCSDVPSGYVGVKVNLLGSDKGVDIQELGTGRYWIGLNEQLFTFPTFTQTVVFTKSATEGSPNDDSFTFNSVDGLSVNSDLSIVYSIDPTKVSMIFTKYRAGVSEISHTFLRAAVRDALVNAASTKPIESMYGIGKAGLIKEVEDRVRAETMDIGIRIEHIYFIGDMRLPPSIVAGINAKAAANQLVAQRENEVAQSRAEADKKVAEAKGDADSTLLRANAEAAAIKIKGDALSKNPEVLELSKIEKWDGHLPQIVGATAPFVNLSSK